MLVNGISKQSFGVSEVYRDVILRRENFYSLSTDDKLDVIYDKLNSLEKEHRGLSENQIKMNNFNKHAFDVIATNCSGRSYIVKDALENINYQYYRNKLDTIV